jgi:ADP-ribose pyrophosphatase YjhB (NUDIX family)
VSNVEFVAITNDVMPEKGRHYVTIWMKGDPEGTELAITDSGEIAEAAWFDPDDLPSPLHVYFENLLAGRCLPAGSSTLPFRASYTGGRDR